MTDKELGSIIGRGIKLGLAPLQKRIDALEQHIADRPGLKYCGVHREDATYQSGDVVTRSGSLWICKLNHCQSTPGLDSAIGWQLTVKRGKDGKDGRDAR